MRIQDYPDRMKNIYDISPILLKSLVNILDEDGKWMRIAEELNVRYGLFSAAQISQAQRENKPAEWFLWYIGTKDCRVGLFCDLICELGMYDALGVLVAPDHLRITQHPGENREEKLVFEGAELKLECQATGLPPPRYVWFHGTVRLEDQTSSTLIIKNFSLRHAGEYHCTVLHEIEDVTYEETSNTVVVLLHPYPPRILEQPEPLLRHRVDDSFYITCRAAAHPTPRYQWYKGNQMIAGAITDTLHIAGVKTSDDGSYYCHVSNEVGEETSAVSRLYVISRCFPNLEDRQIARGKYALLIGNQIYAHLENLKTSRNDVIHLTNKLHGLGFKTLAFHNLTRREMLQALHEFCSLLTEGSYALFYFAGHGFKLGGRFLMPVDTPGCESLTCTDCLLEAKVINEIKKKKPGLLFNILDMCLIPATRNNHPKLFEGDLTQIEDLTQGKEEVYQPQRNQILLYTAADNSIAWEREKSSLYLSIILKHLDRNEPLKVILDDVHKEIYAEKLPQEPFFGYTIAAQIFLTDDSVEDEESRMRYEKLTTLPSLAPVIHFTTTRVKPYVSIQRYNNFLNSAMVTISSLQGLKLDCKVPVTSRAKKSSNPSGCLPRAAAVQNQSGEASGCEKRTSSPSVLREDVAVKCVQGKDTLNVIVHNLQRAKGPITLHVFLKDPESGGTIEVVPLDLQLPLIAQAMWPKQQDVH